MIRRFTAFLPGAAPAATGREAILERELPAGVGGAPTICPHEGRQNIVMARSGAEFERERAAPALPRAAAAATAR